MRKELVVFMILLSIFLAIGCAENGDEGAVDEGEEEQTATPEEEPVIDTTPAAPESEETSELPGEINDTVNTTETAEVSIEDNTFVPSTVTISTGQTVRWTNLDSVSHTVTGTETSFGSQSLNQGDSYEFLFTDAGTYEYYCSIHPEMRGTVIVEEEAE